jgi:hypothetical protein
MIRIAAKSSDRKARELSCRVEREKRELRGMLAGRLQTHHSRIKDPVGGWEVVSTSLNCWKRLLDLISSWSASRASL